MAFTRVFDSFMSGEISFIALDGGAVDGDTTVASKQKTNDSNDSQKQISSWNST